ncbi:sensor histidine kinase, partial [Blautia wexlerae]|nr:sensor histidine kinase [Blautia wexlerae]
LIQTFIENAIKLSNTFDEPIIIRTDIAWMPAGGNSHENIQIQVLDTGCGFSEDKLQSQNTAIPLQPQNA